MGTVNPQVIIRMYNDLIRILDYALYRGWVSHAEYKQMRELASRFLNEFRKEFKKHDSS